MLAGLQDAQNLGIGEHSRDRIEAARERLADQGHVGFDTLVFFGEQLTGAAKAGLDLIKNQRNAVLGAERAHFREITLRRDHHAGFALDRLDQEGHGVFIDSRAEGFDIAERNGLEAGRERAKAGAGVRIGREADNAHGAAMEIVGANDDLGLVLCNALDLVTPFADCLDGGFDGFGTRIHRQDLVATGQAASSS